jgi:hypothetical protein
MGDTYLGGEVFDECVMQHFVEGIDFSETFVKYY